MAIDPTRPQLPVNEEGKIHPMYGFLYVADRQEGLILVPAATLLDGDPTNNFLDRAVTFNPDGKLTGAESVTIVGTYAYVSTDHGLVVVSLENLPKRLSIVAEIGAPALNRPRAVAIQFRYAFVCDADGVKVLDVTDLASPRRDGHGRRLARGRRASISRGPTPTSPPGRRGSSSWTSRIRSARSSTRSSMPAARSPTRATSSSG